MHSALASLAYNAHHSSSIIHPVCIYWDQLCAKKQTEGSGTFRDGSDADHFAWVIPVRNTGLGTSRLSPIVLALPPTMGLLPDRLIYLHLYDEGNLDQKSLTFGPRPPRCSRIISGVYKCVWGKLHFISTNLLLKMAISFHCEYRQQAAVVLPTYYLYFVTNRNHIYLHIVWRLLHITWNIVLAHYYLEIMEVIRPAARVF